MAGQVQCRLGIPLFLRDNRSTAGNKNHRCPRQKNPLRQGQIVSIPISGGAPQAMIRNASALGARSCRANPGDPGLVLPIFEADFHENSFAYRPKRRELQSIDAIKITVSRGRRKVVDADLIDDFHHAYSSNVFCKMADQLGYRVRQWLRKKLHQTKVHYKEVSSDKRIHAHSGVILTSMHT